MAEPDLRIGIDVGGTNTDAVVLDAADRVIAKAKRPTSRDVMEGLRAALDAVPVEPARVSRVMLGTTHATNAILERRGLGRVAVLRLGAPATTAVPPLSDWPADLREAVSAGEAIVPGGHYVDGREIGRLDLDAIRRFLDTVITGTAKAGTARFGTVTGGTVTGGTAVAGTVTGGTAVAGTVTGGTAVAGTATGGRPMAAATGGPVTADAVAVTGVFSPATADHERVVAELIRSEYGLPVSVSHEIGSLGLLERENATVLNAALYGVAGQVIRALTAALAERGLTATPYLAQNDGTLMTLEHAARLPVSTIGSGPANSLRGAAFLSGVPDAIVADVGGTSTDFGVLTGGFPRESAAAVEIGGVLTNFRMPDILAIALGGGTVVRGTRVGPDSVGYRIAEEALVFGGGTTTLTDAAVAAGRRPAGVSWDMGDISEDFRDTLQSVIAATDELAAGAVDRMTLGRTGRPLVAVGGGAFLLPERIPGVSAVIRPEHAEVANAVGAAIALASGRVDTIMPAGESRTEAIERVRREATARAVAAGADPARVQIVDLLEVPLSYLAEPAVRIHAKAAGPLTR